MGDLPPRRTLGFSASDGKRLKGSLRPAAKQPAPALIIGATTVAHVLGAKPGLPVRGGVGLSAVESPSLISLGAKRAFRPHDLLLIADDRESDVHNITMDAHGKGITA